MATVVGKTSERIDALLANLLVGVAIVDNNLVVTNRDGAVKNEGPLGVGQEDLDAIQAELEVTIADNQAAIDQLNTVTLPTLETALENNQNAIDNVVTVTLPGLEQNLNNLNSNVLPSINEAVQQNLLNWEALQGEVSQLSTDTGDVASIVDVIKKKTNSQHMIY